MLLVSCHVMCEAKYFCKNFGIFALFSEIFSMENFIFHPS
jgi:hypothetical protein